ncbi:MAG: hypothetical protein QNK37_14715 [Acidobacteriota bacterium]|nr:hypothetical protein [Acidobacteriota bacterium]
MSTYEEVKREFEVGIAEAMDPSGVITTPGENQVTTHASTWVYDTCITCGHSFRVGDEVQIDEQGAVRHHSALLPCAGDGKSAELGEEARTVLKEFFEGLDEVRPPPKHLPIIRLEDGHLLTAPPLGQMKRRGCAFCGHTFRPGDHVIVCPCNPGDPRCILAIHRDPMHGLNCWETWNPGSALEYCPMSSRPSR